MGPETLVAGAFISASVSILLNKASSPAFKKIAKLYHMKSELKKLNRTLKRIEAVLKDADMVQVKEENLKLWLRELKDLAYHAEDVLEEFEFDAKEREPEGRAGKVRMFLSSLSPSMISFRNKMVGKIKDIRGRLDEIAKERKHLKFEIPNDQRRREEEMRRGRAVTTHNNKIEQYVFGRDEEKKDVMNFLALKEVGSAFSSSSSTNCSNFSVLAIVGIGGLGKTTLAQLAYADADKIPEKDHFQLKMWIHVSEYFSVMKISKEIFDCVAEPHEKPCNIENLDSLHDMLCQKLKRKRFLLVLDDVWDEAGRLGSEWQKLKAPLNHGEKGSKVVITTRNSKVADIMQTTKLIMLNGLSFDDSWLLFKGIAGLEENSRRLSILEGIGKNIVGKLKGVPLAIKTIGGLLLSKSEPWMWENILNSELWDIRQGEQDILPALYVSYQYLSPHLRQCFAYCSLFSKGHKFEKPKLVQMWMAQGFIQTQGIEICEDVGSDCFDDLLCRSFFLFFDGYYLMHDLLHDLARSVSLDECLKLRNDNSQNIPNKDHHIRHLSFSYDNSNASEFKKFYLIKALRTLLYIRNADSFRVPFDLFVELKYLRVLDLSYSKIEDVPQSISNLKHLRFLDLCYTSIKCLPESLSKLSNLQTIKLKQSDQLPALPSGMSNLVNLRHLEPNADLASQIARIGQLTCLQKLDAFSVSKECGYKVGELKDMNELREGIIIQNLENVESREEAIQAELNKKKRLKMLELRWINDNQDVNHRTRELDEQVLEGLQPPPYLDTLIIKYHRGVKCPSWMNSRYLSSLEYINLHICNRWEQLPPFGQLPNLKFLRIEGMNGLKEVGLEFFGGYNGAGFPSLEHLSLEQMPEWEGWSSAAEKGQFFPRLQYLTVRDCPKLRRFPSLPITLKDLIIKNAGFIALPDLWGVDNNGPSISEILICDCPHLISLCEGFLCHHLTALHTLHIDQCSELVSLPGFGSMSSLKSLIVERCPKLAPLQEGGGLPSSLKELCLLNCPNVLSKSLLVPLQNLTSTTLIMMQQYPNLSSCVREALQHLISLECLTIRYVKDIIIHDYEMMYLLSSRSHEAAVLLDYSLNTGGSMSRVQLQIRTLVPDHDEEDNALLVCLRSHLTALSNLSINNCPNVTPLLVDGLPHLASLKFLEVISCRGLTSLPEEETLRHSMKIEELIIRDCRDLTSQGGLHALSQLKSLTIEGCPGLAHLQLKQLTALESLIIDGCEELVLLRGIAALIFLQQLDVNKCPKLTSLTEGEEEGLGRLSSLETLSISYCDSLQRLPIGLQGLSCLRKLHLMMCPLVGSFEVGGNGGGLSASLERLSVTKCPVLMKQCRKEDGPDWPKIKHVPNIRFGQVIVQGFPGVEIFQS